eukprot:jgi/Botrbrau1/10560/Bobra.0343s0008.2
MEDLCDHGDTGALVEVASSKSPLQPSALAVEGQLAREYEKTNEEDFNDLTCAICLNDIDLPELAMVKGCEHAYCASCILTWAKLKEPHTCPQCKNPFSYLLMYRRLDGTLTDFPEEESVCLLKRAQWLTDRSQVVENIHDTDYRTGSVLEDADWVDYHQFIDEFDEDEEVETYYFKCVATFHFLTFLYSPSCNHTLVFVMSGKCGNELKSAGFFQLAHSEHICWLVV